MKYKELVKCLRAHKEMLCAKCPRYHDKSRAECGYSCDMKMAGEAADAIQELTAALTASNEVIATQSKQLAEYHKYDSFLAAHECFDNAEPPEEDE